MCTVRTPSTILCVFFGVTILLLFSCNGAKTPGDKTKNGYLSSEGNTFLDSIGQAFSCAPIKVSNARWDMNGTNVNVLELDIKNSDGDLSFDSIIHYNNVPNLIASRIFNCMNDRKAFDQIQLLITDPHGKGTCVYVYSIGESDVKLERTYLES